MLMSACITINERPTDVLDRVFASMRDQAHDEFVIVLDRSPTLVREICKRYWADDPRTRFVEIDGEPGWRSPVKAWNAGFDALTGTHIYAFSSETVQAAGNIEKAKRLLAEGDAVLHGKAECSCGPEGREVDWGGTAPGNLLSSASHPRPMGFIWAGPLKQLREIGGFDPAFHDGLWHDESDLFYRLWQAGLDFTFTDDISGTHLHHERATLDSPAGQAGIQRNAAYMLKKHGTTQPLAGMQKIASYAPGRSTWRHLT